MIDILVSGASGKMGKAMLEMLALENDINVIGAVDFSNNGRDLGELLAIPKFDSIIIHNDLENALIEHKPQVVLDFTTPQAVYNNTLLALQYGAAPVVGTTGLTKEQVEDITHLAEENKIGAFIAPNFAIGAVLMMKFASEAVKYFPSVEIIELHHDQKIDAPSGTALKTIEAMKPYLTASKENKDMEIIPCSRGGLAHGVRVHSVRLPGFVAHQEVIFGAIGQTLTIRHDSISRESFYPGVILAIRKVITYSGLRIGLETILD